MAKKMKKVSAGFGVPMGCREYGNVKECPTGSIRLYHVPLDNGGYDNGGAYWGLGEPLYCAECCEWNGQEDIEYRRFIRAYSRKEAMEKLNIEPRQLYSMKNI